MQRFVDRVLGRTVEGYFRSTAAAHSILKFMSRHDEVRLELEDKVRHALSENGVIAVRTTLNEFEPVAPDIADFRRMLSMARDRREVLDFEHHNVKREEETEQLRVDTERARRKLAAVELEERLRQRGQYGP